MYICICVHIYTYISIVVKEKEVMNLKGSKGGMGGVERRKRKEGNDTSIF